MKKEKILAAVVVCFIAAGVFAAVTGNKDENYETEEFETEQTTEISAENFNVNESDIEINDELTQHMKELGDACDKYYVTEFNNGRNIISLYSFLYDYSKKKDITIDTLKDGGYYDYPEMLKGASLHYLVPEKVKQYIPDYEDNMKLKIFSALPVKGGVLMHSTDHSDSVISADDYKELMFAHVVSSDVINPKIGSEEYEAIKTDVLDNLEGNYEIKHIACSDKYAVIVTGSLEDAADIRQYLLIRKDGKWVIENDSLSKETSAAMFINENYFDCDLSILPVYNIADYGEIKTDLSNFISTFKEKGYIDSDDNATYQCGAFNCAYFEFESGTKIVGVSEEGQLKIEKVENPEQAIIYMVEKCGDIPAPIFVIKMGDYMIK